MHRTLIKTAALASTLALLAACGARDGGIVVAGPGPIYTKDGRVVSDATVTPGAGSTTIVDRRTTGAAAPSATVTPVAATDDADNAVLVDRIDIDGDGFDDRDTDRNGVIDDLD